MATTKNPVTPAKVTEDLPVKKPVKGGYVIDWRPQDSAIVNGGGNKGIIIHF